MLGIIQGVLVLFFLYALTRVWNRFRLHELSLSSALGWSFFWLAAMVVVVVPNSSAVFAKLVGIGRGADLIVYISLACVFFIIFRLTVRIERLNKQLTTIVRSHALVEAEKTLNRKKN